MPLYKQSLPCLPCLSTPKGPRVWELKLRPLFGLCLPYVGVYCLNVSHMLWYGVEAQVYFPQEHADQFPLE